MFQGNFEERKSPCFFLSQLAKHRPPKPKSYVGDLFISFPLQWTHYLSFIAIVCFVRLIALVVFLKNREYWMEVMGMTRELSVLRKRRAKKV